MKFQLVTAFSVPRDSSHIQDIVPHFALPTTSNAIRCMAENPEKVRLSFLFPHIIKRA